VIHSDKRKVRLRNGKGKPNGEKGVKEELKLRVVPANRKEKKSA